MTEPTSQDAPNTGAMIALVPTAADAARLAIDGGEPIEELHCTVLYLGEAADFEPEEQQSILDWAEIMAANWERVDGTAFAPAFFNPDGGDDGSKEPCAVLVLNGPELAEFYETTAADVTDLVALPEQHLPYIPHITLAYMGEPITANDVFDLTDFIARCGPVSFDRLRVSFGEETTDIPLGEQADEPADEPVDEPASEPVAEPDPAPEIPAAPAMTAGSRIVVNECPFCHTLHWGPCSV
jgi:hypothetical protein